MGIPKELSIQKFEIDHCECWKAPCPYCLSGIKISYNEMAANRAICSECNKFFTIEE